MNYLLHPWKARGAMRRMRSRLQKWGVLNQYITGWVKSMGSISWLTTDDTLCNPYVFSAMPGNPNASTNMIWLQIAVSVLWCKRSWNHRCWTGNTLFAGTMTIATYFGSQSSPGRLYSIGSMSIGSPGSCISVEHFVKYLSITTADNCYFTTILY